MTEMLTKSGGGEYNIHFRTDNPEAYKTVQEICRLFIDKERLTPKKPTHEATLFKPKTCPCCGALAADYGEVYGCGRCGLNFDWSDNNAE